MSENLSVIILAAGQGTRMDSDLPKVLHPIGHKPMLEHVLDTAQQLHADDIHVVYGHGGESVSEAFAHLPVCWVEQTEQLGTGHAVEQAIPQIKDATTVLVLYGDVPLITTHTLHRLVQAAHHQALALLTVELVDPTGYGRIVRDGQDRVIRIVEEKDASTEEKQITEVNTGMMVLGADCLRRWLAGLENNNAQGEYYLTDVIALAVAEGVTVNTVAPAQSVEIIGINNKVQLAEVERIYQRRLAQEIMMQGVTLRDPSRFDLRGDLSAGKDVTIDANVIIEGRVELGDRVTIGTGCVLCDVVIGDDVVIKPYSLIEQCRIAARCQVGPFSRIRPETYLAEGARIGNFVELKKSEVGQDSKISHLSYIGDTTVGSNVNIGAGTITCNYDGANKHRTVIGDGVFVGSNTQFIAPLEVGAGATIGAGSTITRDVPAGKLTLSRGKQTTVEGWQRPKKKN